MIEPSLGDAIAKFVALWPSAAEPSDTPSGAPDGPDLAAFLVAYGPGDFSARPRGRFVVRDVVIARAGDRAEATVLLNDSVETGRDGYPFVARFFKHGGGRWRLLTVDALCPSCFGSGLIDGNSRICDTCAGTGWGTSKMGLVVDERAEARATATVR